MRVRLAHQAVLGISLICSLAGVSQEKVEGCTINNKRTPEHQSHTGHAQKLNITSNWQRAANRSYRSRVTGRPPKSLI